MHSPNLIKFEDVKKLLETNKFFGFTAKRLENRIEYSYVSIANFTITFKVLTTKLNPKEIKSEKIVLGIKINDKELNGWNDFIYSLKKVYKTHKTLRENTYKKEQP